MEQQMSNRQLAAKARNLRADLDKIAKFALTAVAPETCLRQVLRREDDLLYVADESFDLS